MRIQTLSLAEAAAFLGLHPVTLRRKTKAGDVPGFKAGKSWRYVEIDLLKYARSQYAPRALQGDIGGS